MDPHPREMMLLNNILIIIECKIINSKGFTTFQSCFYIEQGALVQFLG